MARAVVKDSPHGLTTDEADLLRGLGLGFLRVCYPLTSVERFAVPLPIKPLLSSLAFVTDKKNYGLHLRLPIVSVSQEDVDTGLRGVALLG